MVANHRSTIGWSTLYARDSEYFASYRQAAVDMASRRLDDRYGHSRLGYDTAGIEQGIGGVSVLL